MRCETIGVELIINLHKKLWLVQTRDEFNWQVSHIHTYVHLDLTELTVGEMLCFNDVIDMREAVPPIVNEKFVHVITKLEETAVIPCVAYASPPPTYR